MAVAEPFVAEPNGVESSIDDSVKSLHSTTNGTTKHTRNITDQDAQELVITSLRTQIQDLYTQVTQLNGKLVKSYNRVSDLEDDIHVASAQLRNSSLKISELELERTQHLAALNTGLLVEKSHVTTELNRLMEKATEEAAQRGQAESARAAIEKDLDDLSASLFNQANTMVAEARFGKAVSERKVVDAQAALKGAEEAVSLMQHQMQILQAEKEEADRRVEAMQVSMGKGKWIDKLPERRGPLTRHTRLLSSHIPYQEFLLFVANLRTVRPASPHTPAIPSLLQLPFLARIASEDSDPTIRLDFAPSLNWLSRRSVLAAVHTGQLTIEPMPSSTLLNERGLVGSTSSGINCALCGSCIYSTPELYTSQKQTALSSSNKNGTQPASSWSTSLFKRPSTPSTGAAISRSSSTTYPPPPPQIYIFRLSSPTAAPAVSAISTTTHQYHQHQHHYSASSSSTSSITALPPNSPTPWSPAFNNYHPSSPIPGTPTTPSSTQSSAIYPLCSNGWCLRRLRTTCTMWAFIRTGIIEKVWEEEVSNVIVPTTPTPLVTPKLSNATTTTASAMMTSAFGLVNGMSGPMSVGVVNGETKSTNSTATSTQQQQQVAPPPVPPRRRTGLWGVAAAFGEKAASWGDSGEKKKGAAVTATPASTTVAHSSQASGTASMSSASSVYSVASTATSSMVATKVNGATATTTAPAPVPAVTAPPPPLPRRNEGRGRSGTVFAPPPGLASRGAPPPPLPAAAAAAQATSTPVPSAPPTRPSSAAGNTGGAIIEEEDEGEEGKGNKAQPAVPPHTSSPAPTSTTLSSPPPPPVHHPLRTTSPPPPIPQRALRHSVILSSAMSVPLPESRPGTPGTPGTPSMGSLQQQQQQKMPQSPPAVVPGPGRSASPVGVKPISPTVGGAAAPPPIPRRAAARTRPVSQTKEELMKDVVVKEETKVEVKEEIKEETREQEKEEVKETTLAPPPPPPPLSANPSSEADSDVFVDAQDGDGDGSSVGAVDMVQSKSGGSVASAVTETVAEVEVEVETKVDEVEVDDVAVKEEAGEETKVNVQSKTEEDSTDDDDKDKDKDREVYIGDATWEERTWKEIVRLKEEMFWARIGVGAVPDAE